MRAAHRRAQRFKAEKEAMAASHAKAVSSHDVEVAEAKTVAAANARAKVAADVDKAKEDYAVARAAAEQNAELRMRQQNPATSKSVRDAGVQVGPARLGDRAGMSVMEAEAEADARDAKMAATLGVSDAGSAAGGSAKAAEAAAAE